MNETKQKVFTTTEEILNAAHDDFVMTEYYKIYEASKAVANAMTTLFELDEEFGNCEDFNEIAFILESSYAGALFDMIVGRILEEEKEKDS